MMHNPALVPAPYYPDSQTILSAINEIDEARLKRETSLKNVGSLVMSLKSHLPFLSKIAEGQYPFSSYDFFGCNPLISTVRKFYNFSDKEIKESGRTSMIEFASDMKSCIEDIVQHYEEFRQSPDDDTVQKKISRLMTFSSILLEESHSNQY